jgi:putative phosphoribosyl transferase
MTTLGPSLQRQRRSTFLDRRDGGRRLAPLLEHLKSTTPVVLGLPRGGVPVADEVAKALDAPLDVIIVRKLGVPWQPELAMGAIGEDGVRVLNRDVVENLRLTANEIQEVEGRERDELERRVSTYRRGRPMTDLAGKTVIIVDDGIATGATAEAACIVARAHGAARVVVGVPVASTSAVRSLGAHADEVVGVEVSSDLGAIGLYYEDFSPTSDQEVEGILQGASSPPSSVTSAPSQRVVIPLGDAALQGLLTLPPSTSSVVVFAHGSGSSMESPRNRRVATHLNRAGHATLLFDLLTAQEEHDRRNVFDIELLGERLAATTRWLQRQTSASDLALGYFGASTGAAAALHAAADLGADIAAIVSRGGRPDLARNKLLEVTSPTLLIVGGRDTEVLELNRQAAARLRCPHEIVVVADATHLFEEPGTLDTVAELATAWFDRYLR